jgi:hypothetical protein
MRRRYDAKFKAKVVLEALREQNTPEPVFQGAFVYAKGGRDLPDALISCKFFAISSMHMM